MSLGCEKAQRGPRALHCGLEPVGREVGEGSVAGDENGQEVQFMFIGLCSEVTGE